MPPLIARPRRPRGEKTPVCGRDTQRLHVGMRDLRRHECGCARPRRVCDTAEATPSFLHPCGRLSERELTPGSYLTDAGTCSA